MSIPKIIHYCWLSDDPVPEKLKGYMSSWKKHLPDYTFMLWNFSNFDKNSSLWVSQSFDAKKYAYAADYIRLYAIYNFGGIYLDMDIEVLCSFNPFLNSSLMLAWENESCTSIEAGCFGAEKNHPYIKECLDYYKDRSFIQKDGSYNPFTLPQIMSRYIKNYPKQKIYTMDYFTCKSGLTGLISKTVNSYAVHHFAASWVPKAKQRIADFQRKMARAYGANYFSLFLTVCAAPVLRAREDGLGSCIAHYVSRYIYRRGIRE